MKQITNFLFFYTLTVSLVVFLIATLLSPSLLLDSVHPSYATTLTVNSTSANNDSSADVIERTQPTKEKGDSEHSSELATSFTPGGGNAQREGILIPPRINPQTPIEPGYIPINLDKSANLTIIYNTTNTNMNVDVCVFTSYPSELIYFRYEVPASPYCVKAMPGSTVHSVLAPGLIGVRATSSIYDVATGSCNFYIYPNESRYCFLNFSYKPYLTTPQETVEQGGNLQIPSK